jgi:catechol 2,3-dioxygenase-like lactoylglutathione lyase family enzyme
VFDHVTIRVRDRDAGRRFYRTILAPLGCEISNSDGDFNGWSDFGIAPASDDHRATRRLHVAFDATSRSHVDALCRGLCRAAKRRTIRLIMGLERVGRRLGATGGG